MTRQVGHAIIWPIPGEGEETQVRLFDTDEEACNWGAANCPRGGWQYAAVVVDEGAPMATIS